MNPQDIANLISDSSESENVIQEIITPSNEVLMEAGYFSRLIKNMLTSMAEENGIDLKNKRIRSLLKNNRELTKMLGFTLVYEKSLRNIMQASRKYIDDKEAIKGIETILQAAIEQGKPIIERVTKVAGESIAQQLNKEKLQPEPATSEKQPENTDLGKAAAEKSASAMEQPIAASFNRINYAHLMSEAMPSSQGIPGGRADAPPQALIPAPKDKTQVQVLKSKKTKSMA